MCEQVDFEKMSWHRIQWLLAYNLLSYFVPSFKNVTEGYTSMQIMQILVGPLYSHYIHLCLASYLSLFSQVIHLFLILHGYGYPTATVQNSVLECLLAVPGIAVQACSVGYALPIMTTSLEILQQKLFGSIKYPSNLICHLYTP